jgi:RimJ/RimL family protein N-acetyltransferase
MYVPRRCRSRHFVSDRVPSDARALAAALPDEPRWVETRALLLSGNAVLRHAAHADAAVVLDPALPSGFLVGRPEPALLRDVAAGAPAGFELVVQTDAMNAACAALPGWAPATATVFSLRSPWRAGDGAAPPGIVVCAPPEQRWLARVPEFDEMRFYAALAKAIALAVVNGGVVAVCAAGDVTESLWDVGIDTVPEHRRHGHATAAFRALAAHMAARGRQPVWCAGDDNGASLAMAARLGFEPVDGIAILKRRGDEP